MSTYKVIQPFATVEVNARLQAEGWTVLRFFGRQIQRNVDECVRAVAQAVARRKSEVSTCRRTK